MMNNFNFSTASQRGVGQVKKLKQAGSSEPPRM